MDYLELLQYGSETNEISSNLNTFIDNLSIPAIIIDRFGKTIKTNKKANDIFRLIKNPPIDTCREVVRCYHAIHNFGLQGRMGHCKNCIFTDLLDTSFVAKTPYYKRDGNFEVFFDNLRSEMDVCISITLLDTSDPQYALVSFEELNELRKTKAELTHNKELLELFFQKSHEGFFFMMLDNPVEWNENTDKEEALDYIFSHQRITKVNDAMLSQYRTNSEDFIGLTPNDLFEHDIENGREVWRIFFDDGKLHIDTVEKRFDGTDMIVTGDYTCLYDEYGRITGHFGVQRDVSQQRKNEKTIKESERKYRTLLETILEGVWQIDEDGNTNYVNPIMAEMLGYTVDEMNGKHLFHFMDEKGKEIANKNIEDRKKGIEAQHDFEFIRKDGKRIYCLLQTVPIIKDSEYKGALASVMDITKRKMDEQRLHRLVYELRTANATKDKFFGIIAHDLRSPLASIISYTSKYISNFENSSIMDLKEIIFDISDTSAQLFKLLENLLEWSRINRGKVEYMPINLGLKDFADEASMLLGSNAKEKNIQLINEINGDIIVYVDNNLTQVIFHNLISNAIKFTEEGGKITLKATLLDKFALVEVADTGIGIDEKVIQKLFRIDQKITKSGTAGEKGTGLGLILCKEFVEMQGGEISVESELGKGTKFIFSLPLIKND